MPQKGFRGVKCSVQRILCLDSAIVSHLIHQIADRVCHFWLWVACLDIERKTRTRGCGHFQAAARPRAAVGPPSRGAGFRQVRGRLVPQTVKADGSPCVCPSMFAVSLALKILCREDSFLRRRGSGPCPGRAPCPLVPVAEQSPSGRPRAPRPGAALSKVE